LSLLARQSDRELGESALAVARDVVVSESWAVEIAMVEIVLPTVVILGD